MSSETPKSADDSASKKVQGAEDPAGSSEPVIVFKKPKRRKCLRTTTTADDDEDDVGAIDQTIEDTKELQKLRKRQNGVSVESLLSGRAVPVAAEQKYDPFKLETGGLVEMSNKKTESIAIGNQFATETNERDEDADMMKYIEEELKKRKGTEQQTSEEQKPLSTKSEDLLMQILPNHLQRSQGAKNEEMLSNQMLAGIPEVDLGIEERIRNIEATEEAKLKMLRDKMRNKNQELSLVPTNISVNFQSQQKQRKQPKANVEQKPRPPGAPIRASDDAHVEKFRKHFQRR